MKEMRDVLDELDLGRFCFYCGNQIIDTPVEVFGLFDRLEGVAHDGCASDAAERADERSRADYYGGSSPQTDRERYDEAAETKKRFG